MKDWSVLVADDEPYVVLAIKEVLEGLPAKVSTARDGEEALRVARGERPDLILLDVKMPGLDGFQVATALKKDPATASIPLVFFSALGAPSEKVRAGRGPSALRRTMRVNPMMALRGVRSS